MILDEIIDNPTNCKIIVIGCGGHARSVVNSIIKKGCHKDILLIDNNAIIGEEILGQKVMSSYDSQSHDMSVFFIVALGDNYSRKEKYNDAVNMEWIPMTLVAKTAQIGIGAKLGGGDFIAENSFVGPEACIGDNTIINTGSIIEHETKVGNNCHIAPNVTVCGRCSIGDNCFLGASSVVIDKISICKDVKLGAGTVVTHDITEPGTYVGVPARKIR